jgi:hypothetical protein
LTCPDRRDAQRQRILLKVFPYLVKFIHIDTQRPTKPIRILREPSYVFEDEVYFLINLGQFSLPFLIQPGMSCSHFFCTSLL